MNKATRKLLRQSVLNMDKKIKDQEAVVARLDRSAASVDRNLRESKNKLELFKQQKKDVIGDIPKNN